MRDEKSTVVTGKGERRSRSEKKEEKARSKKLKQEESEVRGDSDEADACSEKLRQDVLSSIERSIAELSARQKEEVNNRIAARIEKKRSELAARAEKKSRGRGTCC